MGESGLKKESHRGFSLIELIVSMAITLIILGAAVTVFRGALSTRARESSKTDAITSAQAALNVMSREIGNSGFGLTTNGIVADSTTEKLHFRTNIDNSNGTTADPGEDVVFYLDGSGDDRSVVRRDNNTGVVSGIINRVSSVSFAYQNYVFSGTPPSGPDATTGKVTISLTVELEDIPGQPPNQTVMVNSDVTLRNAPF